MASNLSASLPGVFKVTPRAPVDGKSAYEVAVENGFAGTEAQWLESLVGPQGEKGDPGGTLYTTLARQKGGILTVTCHGLAPNELYYVHLYTSSRRSGNAQNEWRHPANDDSGEFTWKGYARLAGKLISPFSSNVWPDVPDWMPRNGILNTEWAITTSDDHMKLNIDLCEWLLPMLKPIGFDFVSGGRFLGISTTARAPLLMRFHIVRASTGEIGWSRNTLRVGAAGVKGSEVSLADGKIDKKCLYVSII